MKPEAQRIAIAEACGYYLAPEDGDPKTGLWWLCHVAYPDGIGDYKSDKRLCWKYAPDYLNDLNAMHEAEKVLTDEQDSEYSEALERVVGGRFNSNNSYDMKLVRSATAAQRAEAFLRTIGKWEESA